MKAAMDLNDGGELTEVVVNLRSHRLTDSLDSKRWEFIISCYNGNGGEYDQIVNIEKQYLRAILDALVTVLYSSGVEAIRYGMQQVATNIVIILSGKIDVLKILRTHEILNQIEQVTEVVCGIVPRWWCDAVDGRSGKPYISPAQWELELKAVAFAVLDSVSFDSEEHNQLDAIMMAKPSVEPASCQSQDYALPVGLSRTIRTEALSNSAVCEADDFENSLNVALDVFAKFQERQGDDVLDSDSEFAVANGPRRADDRNGSRGSPSARGGRLASLNWVPHEQKHLTSEEIEIKLHAIDLNFKDAPQELSMTYLVQVKVWAQKMPLAKKVRAVMYATVGKGEIVEFPMDRFNIPRSRTYQHHDTRFVEGATREINGRGVDVALTSLPGELLQATWRCVAEFGIMVETSYADDGSEDVDFVRKLESLSCAVELVRVSEINKEDVARAIQLATNLKGILQTSMVLCDEVFSSMACEDWSTATLPMVRGTWNLHNITCQVSIKYDFLILLSPMSGATGLAGQSNYASASTSLSSFVQYRTALGIRTSCIDQRAVQNAGPVNDETLLKRMHLASTNGVSERELLEAIGRAILLPSFKSESGAILVDNNILVLGILTSTPLGRQESRAFCEKDGRMAVYHNPSMKCGDGPGMLGMRALEGLGEHAAQGLLKLYGEEAS
ncbi:Compactin diketide synthase mokB [Trichoderma lentiforme]|uniref:Compactin diketide synthase mokB n=1 Tax=Trichoderma lentiforme TaxID=1567552 RepID=A0A9P4X9A7_9HYPO|nr:Compactin diketide synthase mokB [Trichoderma lentiforme]